MTAFPYSIPKSNKPDAGHDKGRGNTHTAFLKVPVKSASNLQTLSGTRICQYLAILQVTKAQGYRLKSERYITPQSGKYAGRRRRQICFEGKADFRLMRMLGLSRPGLKAMLQWFRKEGYLSTAQRALTGERIESLANLLSGSGKFVMVPLAAPDGRSIFSRGFPVMAWIDHFVREDQLKPEHFNPDQMSLLARKSRWTGWRQKARLNGSDRRNPMLQKVSPITQAPLEGLKTTFQAVRSPKKFLKLFAGENAPLHADRAECLVFTKKGRRFLAHKSRLYEKSPADLWVKATARKYQRTAAPVVGRAVPDADATRRLLAKMRAEYGTSTTIPRHAIKPPQPEKQGDAVATDNPSVSARRRDFTPPPPEALHALAMKIVSLGIQSPATPSAPVQTPDQGLIVSKEDKGGRGLRRTKGLQRAWPHTGSRKPLDDKETAFLKRKAKALKLLKEFMEVERKEGGL